MSDDLLFDDPVMDRLVQEVAKGIRQCLLFLGEEGGPRSLADVARAAQEGRDENAEEWVFEFIKDGITAPAIEQVKHESEAVALFRIMGFTRGYLERFCQCRYLARNPNTTEHIPYFCSIHKEHKVVPING